MVIGGRLKMLLSLIGLSPPTRWKATELSSGARLLHTRMIEEPAQKCHGCWLRLGVLCMMGSSGEIGG